MDNIYHQYWQQELMYQLASADRCRKRAYICSPFRADTHEQCEKNLRTARAYMFYANKKMNMNAAAPHAYLPLLLCDEIPAERAIALRFGLGILEQSDVMLVCGNKLSNGMRGEIAKAALLRMPITVFDEGLYLEVEKLVTQNNGNKKPAMCPLCHADAASGVYRHYPRQRECHHCRRAPCFVYGNQENRHRKTRDLFGKTPAGRYAMKGVPKWQQFWSSTEKGSMLRISP